MYRDPGSRAFSSRLLAERFSLSSMSCTPIAARLKDARLRSMVGGAASSSSMLWLRKRRLMVVLLSHRLSSSETSLSWSIFHHQLATSGHIATSWLTSVKVSFFRMHHLLCSPHTSCEPPETARKLHSKHLKMFCRLIISCHFAKFLSYFRKHKFFLLGRKAPHCRVIFRPGSFIATSSSPLKHNDTRYALFLAVTLGAKHRKEKTRHNSHGLRHEKNKIGQNFYEGKKQNPTKTSRYDA